jgi:DNA topoisomerase-1
MVKKLVIVESPAKAKTVSRMLGSSYSVKASVGHVRDLPRKTLGVDVQGGFTPKYEVPTEKKAVVKEIKEKAKDAAAVYLATDPDREGEAISWHLVQAAKLDSMPVKRVVFHELTGEAVAEAFRHPRDINMDMVYAQQARRILDRLVGYKISPLLGQKVRRGLSAGRVQSVALRMIVDREREIEGFIPKEYWSIDAHLEKTATREGFTATLHGFMDGKKIDIGSREETESIVSQLKDASYAVAQVQKKEVARQPAPPFITSTLQQEGWRKLRLSAKRTMALTQQLYEGLPIGKEGSVGLITYMRTDSVRVAPSALEETRAYIKDKYGANFLPPHPRIFRKKVKGAQEAHEAIRPTSIRREPEAIKGYLTRDQFRLYELIWKRMVSSQMSPAILDNTTVNIEAKREEGKKSYLLRAASSTMRFPGFTILYSEGRDEAEDEKEKAPLPELTKGDLLNLLGLTPEQHFTQPPNRYTEATLVKALEARGIGRPSTYAPIIATIQERDYVGQDSGRFHPTELGCLVSDKLCQHFPDIVDFGFTAQMEEGLDRIAQGERQWVPYLEEFYNPFEKTLQAAREQMEKVKIADEPTDEVCTICGRPLVIKLGRYGKFMACSGYPECKNTKPLLVKIGVTCPKCGGELVVRRSRKKRTFYGCSGYPDCDFTTSNRPISQPCPECGGLLVMRGKTMARCTKCEFSSRADGLEREAIKV